MDKEKNNFLVEIADYYAAKLAQEGETASGVDWNSGESQILRFEQLCKLIEDTTGHFSINDLGCGYGAFYDFLSCRYATFTYHGYDVSAEMIQASLRRNGKKKDAFFYIADRPEKTCDFAVASGIFNVRLGHSEHEWQDHVERNIALLDRSSRMGFAFNCLTTYSDREKMRDYLYYADPCRLFDLCKQRYSPNVALLHDYKLYEFTLLVRKVV